MKMRTMQIADFAIRGHKEPKRRGRKRQAGSLSYVCGGRTAWYRINFFLRARNGAKTRFAGLWSRWAGTQALGGVGKSRIMSDCTKTRSGCVSGYVCE